MALAPSRGDTSVLGELRAFLDDQLPAHFAQWGEVRRFAARLDWQRRRTAFGWTALSWPRAFGGRELNIVDRIECELEFSRRGAPPLAALLGVNNVGPTLIAYGTAEQQRHLAAILSGEELWCQGFSEPDAGSDLASMRTRARVDGDGFVLSGSKVWTTNGMEATHSLVLARTDPAERPHRGISALLVPLDAAGVTRRPIVQIDGGRDFAELVFDDVRLSPDALLGELHRGWQLTMTTLAFERAAVISQIGDLERDIAQAIDRHRGSTDASLRQELVRRYIEGRVLGFSGARALEQLRGGEPPGPAQSLIRIAQSRLRQQLALTRVRGAGIAAVAGPEPALAAELLLSRSVTIAAGTTEILKSLVAERVLGLPADRTPPAPSKTGAA
jgi:3-oxochol-4-en-24-oyl-CoA dehydrogenase